MSGGAFASTVWPPVCFHPSCHRLPSRCLVLSRESRRACSHRRKRLLPLYPRGPRSRPGSSVPIHPHLLGPIRPAHGAQFDFTFRLIRIALAVRQASATRRPLSGSALSLRILSQHDALYDSGKFDGCTYPVPRRQRWPWSKRKMDSALPTFPQSASRGGWIMELDYSSLALRPVELFAPWRIGPSISAQPTGTFTSGLPMNWSPAPSPDIATVATGQVPRAGLAPTRMTTSIAALRFAPASHPVNGNTCY
jgi:hypothetical protein